MNEKMFAQTIADYWTSRGWKISVRLDTVPAEGPGSHRSHSQNMAGVRSNLVNGLPFGYRDISGSALAISGGSATDER